MLNNRKRTWKKLTTTFIIVWLLIFMMWGHFWHAFIVNPFTSRSDQKVITPYIINTLITRQVMKVKKLINWGMLELTLKSVEDCELCLRSWYWKGSVCKPFLPLSLNKLLNSKEFLAWCELLRAKRIMYSLFFDKNIDFLEHQYFSLMSAIQFLIL